MGLCPYGKRELRINAPQLPTFAAAPHLQPVGIMLRTLPFPSWIWMPSWCLCLWEGTFGREQDVKLKEATPDMTCEDLDVTWGLYALLKPRWLNSSNCWSVDLFLTSVHSFLLRLFVASERIIPHVAFQEQSLLSHLLLLPKLYCAGRCGEKGRWYIKRLTQSRYFGWTWRFSPSRW